MKLYYSNSVSFVISKFLLQLKMCLVIILVLGATVFAQDSDKSSLPPLTPVRLFFDKTNPKRSVMLARSADSDQGLILLVSDGENIYNPPLLPDSVIYHDGGTADLYLQSGERIVLPSKRHYNEIDTTLGPTIIYPNEAPTYLQEIDILSDQIVEKFGYKNFVVPSSKVLTVVPQSQDGGQTPLPNIDSKVIMLIQVINRQPITTEKKLKAILNQLDPRKVRVLEKAGSELRGRYNIILLADEDMVNTVIDNIPEDSGASINVFDPYKSTDTDVKVDSDGFRYLLDLLEDDTHSLQQLGRIVTVLNNNFEHLQALTSDEKDDLVYVLADILGDLDQTHAHVHKLALSETAIQDYNSGKKGEEFQLGSVYNSHRAESHALKSALLDPLRFVASQLFELLDRIDYGVARSFLVETASAVHGTGIPLLMDRPFNKDHSYFAEWLDQRRLYLSLTDELPLPADFSDLAPMNLNLFFHSSTKLYRNLGVTGSLLNLKRGKEDSEVSYFWAYNEKTERLPTILFGLPGDKDALKRDFIQYVIDADKKSQALAKWYHFANVKGEHRYPSSFIQGDGHLYMLLIELSFIPQIAEHAVKDFSKHDYYHNVIDIYQQLLEISSISISNSGTYASLLEASLMLTKGLYVDFGASKKSDDIRLIKSAQQLRRVVQTRMLDRLKVLGADAQSVSACSIILSPTAKKKPF